MNRTLFPSLWGTWVAHLSAHKIDVHAYSTWDSWCGWVGCNEWSICVTAELWDICDKLKPWLIRSNHEKGVPGFTSVGGLPSYQLIRVEGEVDGLSESWRHSGSYYHGGHSVRAPACLAESLECSMHLGPSCTKIRLLSFIWAALLKSTLLMLVTCTF